MCTYNYFDQFNYITYKLELIHFCANRKKRKKLIGQHILIQLQLSQSTLTMNNILIRIQLLGHFAFLSLFKNENCVHFFYSQHWCSIEPHDLVYGAQCIWQSKPFHISSRTFPMHACTWLHRGGVFLYMNSSSTHWIVECIHCARDMK